MIYCFSVLVRSMFEWISVMFAWIFGASRMGAQTHDVEQRL